MQSPSKPVIFMTYSLFHAFHGTQPTTHNPQPVSRPHADEASIFNRLSSTLAECEENFEVFFLLLSIEIFFEKGQFPPPYPTLTSPPLHNHIQPLSS